MTTPIAWLYVPASRPELFAKAAAAADGVVVDLEDAVPTDRRSEARSRLDAVRELRDTPVVVRVNPPGSQDLRLDLDAVAPLIVDGVVEAIRVPKVGGRADVDAVARSVRSWPTERPLICQLESAVGVAAAMEVASHPAVRGVMLGEADLRADLGLPRAQGADAGLTLSRQLVVLASRASGLGAPIGSAYTRLDDDEGLRTSTETLRDLGFRGRSCLHPRQVEIVRRVYVPAEEDVAWARTTLDAAEAGRGAGRAAIAAADGSFIDPAVERQAREILGGGG